MAYDEIWSVARVDAIEEIQSLALLVKPVLLKMRFGAVECHASYMRWRFRL